MNAIQTYYTDDMSPIKNHIKWMLVRGVAEYLFRYAQRAENFPKDAAGAIPPRPIMITHRTENGIIHIRLEYLDIGVIEAFEVSITDTETEARLLELIEHAERGESWPV